MEIKEICTSHHCYLIFPAFISTTVPYFACSIARWINKNKSDSKTIEILPQNDKELLKINFSKEELILIQQAMKQAKYGTGVNKR